MSESDSTETPKRNYWWLNASPGVWKYSSIDVGGTQTVDSMGEKRRRPNVGTVKIGDLIIGYQTTPDKKIAAICEIVGEHDSVANKILIMKIEDLTTFPVSRATLMEYLKKHSVLVGGKGPFQKDKTGKISIRNGTLFPLEKSGYNLLMDLIRGEGNPEPPVDPGLEKLKKQHSQEWMTLKEKHSQNPDIPQPPNPQPNPDPPSKSVPDGITYEKYDDEKFCNEVFMDETQCVKLKQLLENKRNIILQGPPGVGKTYAAKRLAQVMLGRCPKKGGDQDPNIEFVQFHQSYSYEDFVMGYKPCEEEKPKQPGDPKSEEEQKMRFELREGVFYRFCDRARKDPGSKYFLIIDEINRGNTSKIFGELLMLIENDHRGEKDKVRLAYRNEYFYVPKNFYIIGMMNTADRGLAMIDYALRRRFAFVTIGPAFGLKSFDKETAAYKFKREGENKSLFDQLINWVEELNEDITKSLGAGYRIGHSYFCGWNEHEDLKGATDEKAKKDLLVAKMRNVVEYDIIPTLEEYWFDDIKKVDRWVNGSKDGKLKGLPAGLGIKRKYTTDNNEEDS